LTKRIDSGALIELNKAMGLTGAGEPVTELADGEVFQTVNVNEIVRRSLTPGKTQGIYTGVMENVHTDAESLLTSVAPYNVGTGVIAPYPDPMPDKFDIWLLSATVRLASGGGTLNAMLTIVYAGVQQGWGVDDSGVAVVTADEYPLAFWNALVQESRSFGIHAGISGVYQHIGLRIPRDINTLLHFRSTSSITATFQCKMTFGQFPVSLGQDGIT